MNEEMGGREDGKGILGGEEDGKRKERKKNRRTEEYRIDIIYTI